MSTTSRSIQRRLAAQRDAVVPRPLRKPCNCMNRACDGSFPLLLTHFPDCINFGESLWEMLNGLVRGIEAWAANEDGVPDEAWEWYEKAKLALGEPVNRIQE